MKMMKLLLGLVTASVMIIFLTTCKKDIMEVQKYDADIILKKNVILLDSTNIPEPLSIEGDLYKFSNNGTLPSVQPGDVLIGQTNGGFIRKIVSIDYSGDEVIFTTSQAALTDVFQKLFISDTIKLDFQNMKAYTKKQEAPIKIVYTLETVELKSTESLINLNNTVLINQTINNTQVLARIKEGTVDFEPDIIRHIDLNTNFIGIPTGINSLTLGATGVLSFNCLAEVVLNNALQYNKEISIVDFSIGPFWLGPVPLYIDLGFDAGVQFNFEAECSLEAGFNANASVTFGAQYQNDNGWSTLWNRTLDASQLPTVWNAEAFTQASVYVKPSVGISIAGAVGPYMDVKPDLVFDGEINVPTWNYDLVGGIDGTLGFKVEIFSFTLADYNAPLFRYEKQIASQSGMMLQKPSLTTNIISEITNSSAKTGGVITSNGGSEIIAKGVCWSLNNLPDSTDSHTNDGQGDAEFISDIAGLTENKTYFVRAYATNSKGTGYGNVRMFLTNTDPTPPTIVTGIIDNITSNFASVSCEVTSDGGAPVTTRGVCYSTNPNPTISNTIVQSGNGTGSFTVNISGLSSDTKYYVKAYAENSVGLAYGDQKDFTTEQESNDPIAAFTAYPTSGNAPLEVEFEDKSSNNPTSWLWNFGDGQTSNEQNPIHTYINPGTFTIKLTVENQYGVDFEQKNDYVTVNSSYAINIIIPSGGEEWTIGQTYQIQWDDNISENVKIQLKRNGSIVHTIANSAPSSGSYNWEIPNSLTAGNNYRVNIQSVNNSNIYDESAGDFSLVEQGNISVNNPNSSTIWFKGQNAVIEWGTGELGGTVKIELFKNNMQVETITNGTANNGFYSGYTVSTSLAEDDDYQVKITLIDNQQKFDFSDFFKIQEATQNQPPDKPSNPNPGNGQEVEESSITLSWDCTDPDEDPLTFDVYAAKNNSNPTSLIAQGISDKSVFYSNLDPGATYYWKVVAKDDHQNVTVGDVWSFSTILVCPQIISDIDGNQYETVLIGAQCWMKENLKTTTYRNGITIPNVTDIDTWNQLTTGAYVWYDNNITWKNSYGALYNWYTVTDINGLCPEGWHVPLDSEWTILTDFLGGMGSPYGNELKSCRQVNSPLSGNCNTTIHPRWNEHAIQYGTDDYGFSGLPGGYIVGSGFNNLGQFAYWWSSSERQTAAFFRRLNWSNSEIQSGYYIKQYGFSIRCLQNN